MIFISRCSFAVLSSCDGTEASLFPRLRMNFDPQRLVLWYFRVDVEVSSLFFITANSSVMKSPQMEEPGSNPNPLDSSCTPSGGFTTSSPGRQSGCISVLLHLETHQINSFSLKGLSGTPTAWSQEEKQQHGDE